MPKIRAVIFDCYGTLVDILTDEGKDEVFAQVSLYLRYYGSSTSGSALKSIYQAEKEQYLNTRGEHFPEFDMAAVFKTILHREGLNNPFLVESCCKIFRMVSRERFRLFPDSLHALREIKRSHLPMAMLSNAQDVFFHDEVRMLGLRQFFNYFVVSSYWGFKKPDPRLFSLASSLCNVSPAEAVYIGDDTITDVKGAHDAGLRAILIDRNEKQKDREPKPELYVADLGTAVKWILENS
jgi:putative hydrolase of the HAD superfamily